MSKKVLSCVLVVLGVAACGGPSAAVSESSTVPEEAVRATTPLPITDGLAPLAVASACGAFDELGPVTPMPALGGRLVLALPSDAVSVGRAHDLMSAPASDERETRFVIERGESRMVVFVEETFASPGDAFVRSISRFAATRIARGTVTPVNLASGLDAVVVEASSVDGPEGGVVVDEAWITTPEGTVVSVGIFVTTDLVGAPDGCRSSARAIALGVGIGDARLDLAGGPRRLDRWTIDLPANAVLVHDEGPDFDVYEIVSVAPFDADASSLGIYVGGHPSFEPTGTERPGRLLGRETPWWVDEVNGQSRREAIVGYDDGSEFVHAFVRAQSPIEAESLVRVAESLRDAR